MFCWNSHGTHFSETPPTNDHHHWPVPARTKCPSPPSCPRWVVLVVRPVPPSAIRPSMTIWPYRQSFAVIRYCCDAINIFFGKSLPRPPQYYLAWMLLFLGFKHVVLVFLACFCVLCFHINTQKRGIIITLQKCIHWDFFCVVVTMITNYNNNNCECKRHNVCFSFTFLLCMKKIMYVSWAC